MKTQETMRKVLKENLLDLLKSLSLVINDFARIVEKEKSEVILKHQLHELQICCKTPERKVSDFIFYCNRRPYRELVQVYKFMTKHEELHKGIDVLGEVIKKIDAKLLIEIPDLGNRCEEV